MSITELVLGATRAAQILLSVITIGLASGTIHVLLPDDTGAAAPNRYALFTTITSFLSVMFLVTSQFLFVKRYNGYTVYITTGVILEVLNWTFTFASWIAIAQFSASPNCATKFLHKIFYKSCEIDRALLGFLILLWMSWSTSLSIMIRLKITERRDQRTSKEIELRIKNAVETQSGMAQSDDSQAEVLPTPTGREKM